MMRPDRLLFVCSGNICRSPMAERISVWRADIIGRDVEARSAGILGINGAPADNKAIAVCQELGLDLTNHRSQGISDELLRWATHVLVMDLEHASHLRAYYPLADDKMLMLGPFGGYPDIPDPVGLWTWNFRRTRRQLETCIDHFLRRTAR